MFNVKKAISYEIEFEKDFPQVDTELNIPFITDKKNKVIFGNMIRNQHLSFNEEIQIVELDIDEYTKNVIIEIEMAIASENNPERLRSMEEQLMNYLKNHESKIEMIQLFDYKEQGLITEDNFIAPPAYNFVKAKRGEKLKERLKEMGLDENEGLFSDIGDE